MQLESASFNNFSKPLVVNFLEIAVLLYENGLVETDIFYKETNSHDHHNYNDQDLSHIKCNIPFNLAKRIFLFASDEQK